MTTENKMIRINDIEAAKKLVSAAVKCPFDIDIVSKGKIFIDAKSILGQCQAHKCHCKQCLNSHCHVNLRCCFLCEGGVFSQEFIDLFVPVYRQEAGYCENFFIHDIHGYEDTAEETHPQGDHIGESTEHMNEQNLP